jgi:nitrilase
VPDSTVRIAAAQITPIFLNRDETVRKACDAIARAAADGAKLVVFPEAFIPGYPDWVWVVPNHNAALLSTLYTRLLNNAVTIPDESTDALCEAARRAGICVVMGMHERNAEASNASVFNTLLFIDERGQIMGKRRKLVPTGAERQVWAQGDGSTLQVFPSSVGRLGGLICWENYMPLARHALFASLRYIAREGGVFIVSCCTAIRTDDIPEDAGFKDLYPGEREWINVGNSCVVNPKGELIAGPLEATEGMLYAELDLEEIFAAKRMFDVAGHYARPDVFDFSVRGVLPQEDES